MGLINFSLHREVEELVNVMKVDAWSYGEGDLGEEKYHRDSSMFRTNLKGMRRWCRQEEMKILAAGSVSKTRVFAGFQKLSLIQGIVYDRYKDICESVGELWLFGLEDWRSNIQHSRIVSLRNAELLDGDNGIELFREWFLIIDGRRHKAIIVAEEEGFKWGSRKHPDNRRFEGFISFNPKLVVRALEQLQGWVSHSIHAKD